MWILVRVAASESYGNRYDGLGMQCVFRMSATSLVSPRTMGRSHDERADDER